MKNNKKRQSSLIPFAQITHHILEIRFAMYLRRRYTLNKLWLYKL